MKPRNESSMRERRKMPDDKLLDKTCCQRKLLILRFKICAKSSLKRLKRGSSILNGLILHTSVKSELRLKKLRCKKRS